jgi:hypothetical protein
MKLPKARAAKVDPKKLKGYLLSSTHPIGRPKAQFFLAVGFSETDVVPLERALLEVARTGEVAETANFGARREVHGGRDGLNAIRKTREAPNDLDRGRGRQQSTFRDGLSVLE